jgi:hypothetical protein
MGPPRPDTQFKALRSYTSRALEASILTLTSKARTRPAKGRHLTSSLLIRSAGLLLRTSQRLMLRHDEILRYLREQGSSNRSSAS